MNNRKESQVPDKLKLKLIPIDDFNDRALDLPLDLPRDEDLDPRPLENDLLYSKALLFLLRVLLVVGLPFLGGLAMAQVYRHHQDVIHLQVPKTCVVQLRDRLLTVHQPTIENTLCHQCLCAVFLRWC